jgi:hypothetical protein
MLSTYLAQVSALPTYESCQGWTFAIYAGIMLLAIQLKIDESCNQSAKQHSELKQNQLEPGKLSKIELEPMQKSDK